MQIPVRAAGRREFANCQLISRPPTTTAREWRQLLLFGNSGEQQDSIEFVESAVSKWKLYERRNRVARSQRQLINMIRAEPKIDVLAILDAQTTWSELGPRVGICQFRHTWSNSIAVDFLAVHPALLTASKPISGIGTALLYALSQLARRIEAQRIWLETTELSVGYYTHLFGTAVDNDLLIAPFDQFYDKLHARFENANAPAP